MSNLRSKSVKLAQLSRTFHRCRFCFPSCQHSLCNLCVKLAHLVLDPDFHHPGAVLRSLTPAAAGTWVSVADLPPLARSSIGTSTPLTGKIDARTSVSCPTRITAGARLLP